MGLEQPDALRMILQGTARETGEGFFRALVENLANALGTFGAWVTEYLPDRRRLRALSFRLGDRWNDGYEFAIDGTPCETVIETKKLVHYPDRIIEVFPRGEDMRRIQAVSYMGVPLTDLDGTVLGHLAVMDRAPMPAVPENIALFEIFAGRAAAELQRLRAEREAQAREAQLAGLVGSAMDAIVQLDADLRVTRLNPAAESAFALAASRAEGLPLDRLVLAEDAVRLSALAGELVALPPDARRRWVPGGLTGRAAGARTFPAEASLSAFELRGQHHFTLILRNLDDKLEADRKIRALTDEAEWLRDELRALGRTAEILGESEGLRQVLHDLRQVAPETTTVLVLGETGTGKELVARAIHAASPRRDGPLVKVNCAALPAALVESELFGHEKGAFTGAVSRREGRFTLADGGTLLLDEVGELPLELQAKLLRILQEGELEPVGSSRTRKVDVRVVAATNRDLFRAAQDGRFREDLYYRLSVFPITLPPLRDRGDDVVLLAEEFARQFARRMGRRLAPLPPDTAARLRQYTWPGNVRELQNVIERAVITARDGRLDLDRALPLSAVPPAPAEVERPVLRADELLEIERANLRRALEQCDGKIAGEAGAARLLGIAPSTFSSRMKALGIRRS